MDLTVVLPANLPSKQHIEIFFARAITSLHEQTFKEFKLNIILNGIFDYDNSLNYIQKRLKKDFSFKNEIFLYSTENKLGVSKALNIGLKAAKTEYIALQASDDTCENTRFEEQINLFNEKKDLDICGTGMYHVVEGQKIPCEPFIGSYEQFREGMAYQNLLFAGTVMCKSFILEEAGYFDESFGLKQIGEDYDLWKKIAANGANISNVKNKLYTWYHDYSTFT